MDEERLMSKKEVLEKMGISYGQLYRWKRKGLIPEAWFVRRSTFTGQETFFPRDKILERIGRIKSMKDDHPLDDLAELITERVNSKLKVAFDQLERMGWLDDDLMQTCRASREENGTVSLRDAFCLGVLSRIQGVARPEEIDLVRRTLEKELANGLLERLSGEGIHLHLLRKRVSGGGISAEVSVVVVAGEGAMFDPELDVVKTVDLAGTLQRIRLDVGKSEETRPAANGESEAEAKSDGFKEEA